MIEVLSHYQTFWMIFLFILSLGTLPKHIRTPITLLVWYTTYSLVLFDALSMPASLDAFYYDINDLCSYLHKRC